MENLKTSILQVTNGGKDIILSYYPQAEESFIRRNRAFAIRDEKTPSVYVKYVGDRWLVTDFGDDGKPKDCFAIAMDCEHKDFKGVLQLLADKYLNGVDNIRLNARRIEYKPKPIDYIPTILLRNSFSSKSNFIRFLFNHFSKADVERVCTEYMIGATKRAEVIFWQIDQWNNVRTGKIMQYDQQTGHRLKENGFSYISWVHTKMKDKLPKDFNMRQCLFGEHLLTKYPDRMVALVEAEKTAVIGAIMEPDYVWVAVGGKTSLNEERLKPLLKRKMIVFPDTDEKGDCYSMWCTILKRISFESQPIISRILEENATKSQKLAKIDIADLWLNDIK